MQTQGYASPPSDDEPSQLGPSQVEEPPPAEADAPEPPPVMADAGPEPAPAAASEVAAGGGESVEWSPEGQQPYSVGVSLEESGVVPDSAADDDADGDGDDGDDDGARARRARRWRWWPSRSRRPWRRRAAARRRG